MNEVNVNLGIFWIPLNKANFWNEICDYDVSPKLWTKHNKILKKERRNHRNFCLSCLQSLRITKIEMSKAALRESTKCQEGSNALSILLNFQKQREISYCSNTAPMSNQIKEFLTASNTLVVFGILWWLLTFGREDSKSVYKLSWIIRVL